MKLMEELDVSPIHEYYGCNKAIVLHGAAAYLLNYLWPDQQDAHPPVTLHTEGSFQRCDIGPLLDEQAGRVAVPSYDPPTPGSRSDDNCDRVDIWDFAVFLQMILFSRSYPIRWVGLCMREKRESGGNQDRFPTLARTRAEGDIWSITTKRICTQYLPVLARTKCQSITLWLRKRPRAEQRGPVADFSEDKGGGQDVKLSRTTEPYNSRGVTGAGWWLGCREWLRRRCG